ncbi:MAG: putative lipid II flippase FtsW [Bdellovibrionales bacterium]
MNTSRNSYEPSIKRPGSLDSSLLLIIAALLGVGLVQVYSASYIYAFESLDDGLYFFRKQFLFTILAIAVIMTTAKAPWHWVEKYGKFLWFIGVLGVIGTFIPGIGVKAGGAIRWIHLGIFNFEPSELLKVSLPLLLASFLCHEPARDETSGTRRLRLLVQGLMIFLPFLLLLKQPDFGSVVICTVVLFSILFCYGMSLLQVAMCFTVAFPTFYFLVVNVPYRYARLKVFLDPWADPEKGGFQLIQSMMGFYSGGLTGVGLGQGLGKLFFLPEAHTDFTLSVLGEEIGFIGVLFVLGLYALLIIKGFQTASRASSRYARIAALGIIVAFVCQVQINAGVAMGLFPTKGLTLPFLSYGGSSLLMTAFSFGLLLNIRRSMASN